MIPRTNHLYSIWRAAIACTIVGATVVLFAACGSPSKVPAGSAATNSPATGPSSPPSGTLDGLDLGKLGSLTNYAATTTSNGLTISVDVASPTNWSESMGGPNPFLHIDGSQYVKSVNTQGQPAWLKMSDDANAYQTSPYPGTAAQFANFTKVAYSTITKGGTCTAAGTDGHLWTISSLHTSIATEVDTACVADSSGALLTFKLSSSGSDLPGNLSESFTITQIGGITPFAIPSPLTSA